MMVFFQFFVFFVFSVFSDVFGRKIQISMFTMRDIFESFSNIIYYVQKGYELKQLLQTLVIDFCSLKACG